MQPSTKIHRPLFAPILAGATTAASLGAALHVHGALLHTVTSRQLLRIGAVDGRKLAAGEWWRLLTCQLLHVYQLHMLFNVGMILLIGWALERAVGSARFVGIYMVSGTAGIAASVLLRPELVSSGASQALMGIAAAALVAIRRGFRSPRWLSPILIAVLTIQLVLDLVVAHHPKPGHVAGFFAGLLLGAIFLPRHGTASPPLDAPAERPPSYTA